MYNQPSSCNTGDVITGWSDCQFDLNAPAKLFFEKPSHAFDTLDDAKDLDKWGEAIVSKDILPTPLISEMDNNSEDDTYYTSPITAIDKFIREGKASMKFRIEFDPCLYKRLRGLNGTSQRLITVDTNQNVVGTSPDSVKFQGIISGTLRVEKWIASDGSSPAWIPIHFVAESGLERNDRVAIFNVDWNILGLNGVQPASLAVDGTPTATEIVVNVASACDGVSISGLVVGDFEYLLASGVEETITTVTESATITGQYTLAGAAFATGTASLKDVVTLGDSYYQGIAVEVTIA